MFLDMIIFMFLARAYKSIPLSELDNIDEELLNEDKEKKSPLEFPGKPNDGFKNDD